MDLNPVPETSESYAGQVYYTAKHLKAYDFGVYRVNTPWFWRCPKSMIQKLYDQHISMRHLDIGVATGSLLGACNFPGESPEIALMDLNPEPLKVASKRLERYSPSVHQADVLQPWPFDEGSFDSIGMGFLLHCLSGDLKAKSVVFEYAREALSPSGVLFGTTILGLSADHTFLSRRKLVKMNEAGTFGNLDDTLEDLKDGLARTFESHTVEVRGTVALFRAEVGDAEDSAGT